MFELESQLAKLVAKFEQATLDKNNAIEDANWCSLKLSLAQRLVAALSSEKDRWKENISLLDNKI